MPANSKWDLIQAFEG